MPLGREQAGRMGKRHCLAADGGYDNDEEGYDSTWR